MKRFRVAGVATISVHTDVDAETPRRGNPDRQGAAHAGAVLPVQRRRRRRR
jgi:hypothetical protein